MAQAAGLTGNAAARPHETGPTSAGNLENIGIYAERLLEYPLPWTRMRSVCRLVLVRDFDELVVERHRRASTIVTLNPVPSKWLSMMGHALLAQFSSTD